MGLEGEWERIKVPWIRPFELSSPEPAPSFAPGCDLPKATTHSPLLPTWWGPQKYLEANQSSISSCWAVLLSFPERGAGRAFQMPPVPGVVCLCRGPAEVEEPGPKMAGAEGRCAGSVGGSTPLSSWFRLTVPSQVKYELEAPR